MFTFLLLPWSLYIWPLGQISRKKNASRTRLEWLLKYAKYAPEPPSFPEDVGLLATSPPSFPSGPPTHSIPALYAAPNARILTIADDPLTQKKVKDINNTSFHPVDPDMPFKGKRFGFLFSLTSKNTPGPGGTRGSDRNRGWGGGGIEKERERVSETR